MMTLPCPHEEVLKEVHFTPRFLSFIAVVDGSHAVSNDACEMERV
jgi:hypothetical protein